MSRQETEESFWALADKAGLRAVLQRIIDEMPMSKLTKLVRQIEVAQPLPARTPEDDAVEFVICTGIGKAEAVGLLAEVKATVPAPVTAEDLVRAMLGLRAEKRFGPMK